MTTAKVKMIDVDRGFGFLTADDGSGDFFFHRSAVADDAFDHLQRGERVEFERDDATQRGPRAKTVKRLVLGIDEPKAPLSLGQGRVETNG